MTMKTMVKWIKDMPWLWMAAMFFGLCLLDLAMGRDVAAFLNLGVPLGWGASMVVAKRRGWIGGR